MIAEVQVARGCAGCKPHVPHYGRCFNFIGPDGLLAPECDCKLEEPPLPYLAESAAERGYADDDAHEDWLGDRGAGSSWLIHEEEMRI